MLRPVGAHPRAEARRHHDRCEGPGHEGMVMAGAGGFEPPVTGPKPAALPLGYAPPSELSYASDWGITRAGVDRAAASRGRRARADRARGSRGTSRAPRAAGRAPRGAGRRGQDPGDLVAPPGAGAGRRTQYRRDGDGPRRRSRSASRGLLKRTRRLSTKAIRSAIRSRRSRNQRAACSRRCSTTAARRSSAARRYQTGATTQARARAAQPPGRPRAHRPGDGRGRRRPGRRRSRRPGTRRARAGRRRARESAGGRRRDRSAGRLRSRAAGGRRRAPPGSASRRCSKRPAARRAGQTARTRPQSSSCPSPRQREEHDPEVLRQLERREPLAGSLGELRPGLEEEGDVGADPSGDSVRRRSREGASRVRGWRARVRRPASALPPPRPAASGILFSSRTRQHGSTPAASASRASAARTSVSLRSPSTSSAGARLELDRVAEVDPLHARSTTSCRPSAARRSDDEREVDLRGGRERAFTAAARPARRTRSGASASARTSPGESRSASSAPSPLSRPSTPASSSAFTSVLRRWRERALNDLLDAGELGPQARVAGRRRAPSPRSAAAGSTVRDDWVEARALGRQLHEHRDRAVALRPGRRRRSGRRPRAGPSRTRARRSGGRRGSRRRAVSRSCTGRLETNLSGGGSRSASGSVKRVAEARGSTFVVPGQRSRRCGSRPRSTSTACTRRDAVGEVSGEHAETGADLEHDVVRSRSASRPATPRMFSSTRKCWPSSRFGATGSFTADRRRPSRSRRSRRSSSAGVLAARRRRARRAYGRRWPARSAGRAPPAARGRGCRSRPGAGRRAHARRGRAKLVRLRVRHVAGEGHVPAALERRPEQPGRREAVEDDRAFSGKLGRARRACPPRLRACGRRAACQARAASSA